MSENGVYPQWNSHLVGIMISKTIVFFWGTRHFQTNPYCNSPMFIFLGSFSPLVLRMPSTWWRRVGVQSTWNRTMRFSSLFLGVWRFGVLQYHIKLLICKQCIDLEDLRTKHQRKVWANGIPSKELVVLFNIIQHYSTLAAGFWPSGTGHGASLQHRPMAVPWQFTTQHWWIQCLSEIP